MGCADSSGETEDWPGRGKRRGSEKGVEGGGRGKNERETETVDGASGFQAFLSVFVPTVRQLCAAGWAAALGAGGKPADWLPGCGRKSGKTRDWSSDA